MRALAAGLIALVAGCGGNDPCAGKSGVCITVEVHGDVGTFDQLRLSATPPDGKPLAGLTGGNDGPITLPVQLAALLPDGTKGQIQVYVSALRNGVPVAGGGATVTVPPSGQRVIVDLISIGTDDGGMPDLSHPDLTSSVDQAVVADGQMLDQTTPEDFAPPPDLFGVLGPPVFDGLGPAASPAAARSRGPTWSTRRTTPSCWSPSPTTAGSSWPTPLSPWTAR